MFPGPRPAIRFTVLIGLLMGLDAVRADVTFSTLDASLNGYVAFGNNSGTIALEDYQLEGFSSGDTTVVALNTMRFVGGVDTAGSTLDFQFFESADGTGTIFNSFSVQLGQAGDFIYTINNPSGTLTTIPVNGSILVAYNAARPENTGGGRIFISQEPSLPAGLSPGNPFNIPGSGPNGEQRNFAFEFTTSPEPSAFVLVMLLGLIAIHLRRARSVVADLC